MNHLVYVIVLGLLQVAGGQDIPLKKGDLVGPRLDKAGEQVVRWDEMSKQTTWWPRSARVLLLTNPVSGQGISTPKPNDGRIPKL